MMKRLLCGALVVILAMIPVLSQAECDFYRLMSASDIVYLAELSDDSAAIAYLYEANAFLEMMIPGETLEKILQIAERVNLQYDSIQKDTERDRGESKYWFSSHFCVHVVGDPVESAELLITSDLNGDIWTQIPFDCLDSAHSYQDGCDTPVDYTAYQNVDSNVFSELYYQRIESIIYEIEAILDTHPLRSTLVEEMLQFSMFASCLYPGIPKDWVLVVADSVPMLKACQVTTQVDKITWKWNHWRLGTIDFTCSFENAMLTNARFAIDYITSPGLTKEFVSRLDDFQYTGCGGTIFCPIFSVDLNNTWMCQQLNALSKK